MAESSHIRVIRSGSDKAAATAATALATFFLGGGAFLSDDLCTNTICYARKLLQRDY